MPRQKWRLIAGLIVVIALVHAVPVHLGMIYASVDGPPPGLMEILHRVLLGPDDPFVVLEEVALDAVPGLQSILGNATYWARANVNETYHWIGNATFFQLKATLDQAYIDKYGVTAPEYAQTHNVTFKVPVVSYAEFNFTISRPEGWSVIIQREHLYENDPRLEWNGSILELVAPLRRALDTAVAWVQYHDYALVYDLDTLGTRDMIFNAFEQAAEDKYGMSNWYDVAVAHNSTQVKPVVAYAGYFFSFSFAFPEGGPPPSSLWLILVTAVTAAVGLVVLAVTLFHWRRLRSELAPERTEEGPSQDTEEYQSGAAVYQKG